MKKALVFISMIVLAGCSNSQRIEENFVYKAPQVKPVETMPLPPPRPLNIGKRCWIEIETNHHAVIERRYCR
jgi:hypothetical protein